MAKEIQSDISIHASPEKVWDILTDFESYPQWNPFIQKIEGPVEKGKKFKAFIHPPGAKGMTFQPTVLEFNRNKAFRWIGHLIVPGLFDGEHRFEIKDNGNGTVTFIQSERFTGILVPLFKKMLDINTLNGFRMMNEQLKLRAEATV